MRRNNPRRRHEPSRFRSPTSWWVRGYRVFFAVLASIGLVVVLAESIGAGRTTVDYLSYFTIQSNLIAIGVLLVRELRPEARPGALRRDVIRWAPVLYLAVTGIVIATLLANVPVVVNPFANAVLHQLIPLVAVADWLIDPPGAGGFRVARSEGLEPPTF